MRKQEYKSKKKVHRNKTRGLKKRPGRSKTEKLRLMLKEKKEMAGKVKR